MLHATQVWRRLARQHQRQLSKEWRQFHLDRRAVRAGASRPIAGCSIHAARSQPPCTLDPCALARADAERAPIGLTTASHPALFHVSRASAPPTHALCDLGTGDLLRARVESRRGPRPRDGTWAAAHRVLWTTALAATAAHQEGGILRTGRSPAMAGPPRLAHHLHGITGTPRPMQHRSHAHTPSRGHE